MLNLKFFIYTLLITYTLENLEQKKEEFLSPEKAEEAYVETLQNHKDDEEIYEFGLAGQQDPDLKKKILLNFGEDFPHLLQVIHLASHIYNKNEEDMQIFNEKIQEQKKEQKKIKFDPEMTQQFEDYQIARKYYKFTKEKKQEIDKEVEKLLSEIDLVTLSSEDLIKALDLEELYNYYVSEIDLIDPTFKKVKREIDLVTFDFAQAIRSFVSSADILTDFFTFGGMLIKSKKQDYDQEDPENILHKVNFGISLLNQLFEQRSKGCI